MDTAATERRYWRHNHLAGESDRLRLLEAIADPRTFRLLDHLGVAPGWRCAELGAGAGSVAAWLADRVGPSGSVLALDRDTNLLSHLRPRSNVEIRESDLLLEALPSQAYDLVHTRNLLMHIDAADALLPRLVESLRPGGVLLLEEADGYPIAGSTSPAFAKVLGPLASRWTWARALPARVAALPVADVGVEIDAELMHGGTPLAAFWSYTLQTARAALGVGDDAGSAGITEEDLGEVLALLEDERFWSPFMAVVCVWGTRVGR